MRSATSSAATKGASAAPGADSSARISTPSQCRPARRPLGVSPPSRRSRRCRAGAPAVRDRGRRRSATRKACAFLSTLDRLARGRRQLPPRPATPATATASRCARRSSAFGCDPDGVAALARRARGRRRLSRGAHRAGAGARSRRTCRRYRHRDHRRQPCPRRSKARPAMPAPCRWRCAATRCRRRPRWSLAVERIGRGAGHLVATVGASKVAPGAINVIPATVAFTIDVRGPRTLSAGALVAAIECALRAIAAPRGRPRDRALL